MESRDLACRGVWVVDCFVACVAGAWSRYLVGGDSRCRHEELERGSGRVQLTLIGANWRNTLS